MFVCSFIFYDFLKVFKILRDAVHPLVTKISNNIYCIYNSYALKKLRKNKRLNITVGYRRIFFEIELSETVISSPENDFFDYF